MADLPKRIAIVYDRVNKWGGAEAVLLALHHLFPDAPLYTSVYSPRSAEWASVFPSVIPTFLQSIPLAATHHEWFPWLTPIAFESLKFNDFDAVISVTSADAKGIITAPWTFHLCYCLTPTRYLWSHYQEYSKQVPLLTRPVFNYLKRWDRVAASRPDSIVSISATVRDRVASYYSRPSDIVYPPVNISQFRSRLSPPEESDYFLYLGRLVPYKHPELIVRAFNRLNRKLIVVGTGSQEAKLREIAGKNIIFKGFLTETEKTRYLQYCQALIFFHEEDFGIVPVEAQAAGIPVIAYNRGGVSETVIHNRTGILIEENTEAALIGAVNRFDQSVFDPREIVNNAARYSIERFTEEFVKIFATAWTKYKNTYTS